MELQLSPEDIKRFRPSIQRFVEEEYGSVLGDLGADTFLRFCLAEIGPAIYNRAIADAQTCLQERVTDLENICFADERNYWAPNGKGVRRKSAR